MTTEPTPAPTDQRVNFANTHFKNDGEAIFAKDLARKGSKDVPVCTVDFHWLKKANKSLAARIVGCLNVCKGHDASHVEHCVNNHDRLVELSEIYNNEHESWGRSELAGFMDNLELALTKGKSQ